ncbi:hypothetical protein HdyHp2_160 [Haloarcula virus Hardyhisp2]|uniref:Uncharacterized protein n=1 Tax=Haloarcula virus Hardyhisp2 TaxID=2811386 RepID=A0A898KA50_9VIRU|nr:hypothetical protein QIT44_gp32 [Haloarcula virus Hardyhisp2]QSJ05052.1 hypothetical protein HdyHp2_160 [Haloarcula virus Hardyhisp2]
MMFVWLLLGPVISLITDLVKPIVIISVAIVIDVQFQLGITDSLVTLAEQQLQQYVANNWTGLL